MDHGQRPQLSKQHFKNANPNIHRHLNPLVNLEEFVNDLDEEEIDAH